MLHSVSDFLQGQVILENTPPSYYYQGYCPFTGELLKLSRTVQVEAIAQGLMRQLAEDESYSQEGKMYGVLLVELPNGTQKVLKAFSGLLNGKSEVTGWIPPIPGRERVTLAESQTLAQLNNIKQELLTLFQLPQRQEYEKLQSQFKLQWEEMKSRHQVLKQQRHSQRQHFSETLTGERLLCALETLNKASRQEGIEQRNFKRQRNEILQPLQQQIQQADIRIRELKQQRKTLSRQLQAQMHAVYTLTNFTGTSLSLQELMPKGLPTGTGDCCAPKLLHYAATHHLKPLAMAEFWWGCTTKERVSGQFYEACVERCQPIMGFMLSGLSSFPNKEHSPNTLPVPILYEDEWLIAVNKPPGLLSVPGRYEYDSVVSRLQLKFPNETYLQAVHRLDLETSGIILVARDLDTYRQLSQQFSQRRVKKVYEAILAGLVTVEEGSINLPLWGNPENRPYQEVNEIQGKPSLTHYQVIQKKGDYTRIEFIPVTGRTHQLRVHAAQGLGLPILGDSLYGNAKNTSRLHLHAREISFQHPQTKQTLHLQIQTPF